MFQKLRLLVQSSCRCIEVVLRSFAILLALFLLPGRALAQEQEEHEVITGIVDAWRERQQSVSRLKYVVESRRMVPKGTYNLLPFTGSPPSRPYPAEDTFHNEVYTLAVDLDNNWAKQTFDGYVLHGESLDSIKTMRVLRDYREHLYDGDVLQKYVPKSRNQTQKVNTELYLRTEDGKFAGRFFSPHIYPVFFGHGILPGAEQSISPLRLRIPPDANLYHWRGRAANEGRPQVVLRTANLVPGREEFYDVWVDVERQAAITRWSLVRVGEEAARCDIQYRRSDGRWLPSRWQYMQRSGGRLMGSCSCVVTEFQIDPTFPPGIFTVRPTAGMRYLDEATRTVFEKSDSGQPDLPARRARFRDETRRARVRWLTTGIVVLLGVSIGTFFWIRAIKRRR